MKKTTKGAIAAGAAALLLTGGAGTMAAWNASTGTSGAATVTAGSLSISEAPGTGVWKLGTAAFDPATQKIVPGDVVTYSATYNYTLVGTNLKATLKPSLSGLTGTANALQAQLTVANANGADEVVTASGTRTITTSITFDPKDGTFDNSAQGQSVTLSGGAVTLEQKLS
ncbi:alternate-type signal peptide domain-containing protein [Rhodococcus sp. ARC_M6]|uniref:alternate-type signal peptide domain-containing protein n=1 Tax=Rhodococcus sp. ARC_M6 TaxID=2928852 RepID=UPI001FB34709|nr:alternate-type signal peptide domain-containing protein [Rhodococcus sp. ARC_M6]MCJ0901930.1 alternate-type signal peptide domain-containing protein [Rhodococcus sp. ARC_M6]